MVERHAQCVRPSGSLRNGATRLSRKQPVSEGEAEKTRVGWSGVSSGYISQENGAVILLPTDSRNDSIDDHTEQWTIRTTFGQNESQ